MSLIEDKEDYITTLRRRLREKGLPEMDLTCNFHDDGDLVVFISDCSMTGFTTESYYPDGQKHDVEAVADDLVDTFLEYIDVPDP